MSQCERCNRESDTATFRKQHNQILCIVCVDVVERGT
jgi:hypothetical protein